MQWLNMNLIIDIALIVFSAAVVWRSIKMQNQISESREDLNLAKNQIVDLREDLDLVTKNPQFAKRKLKEKGKQSIIS